VKIKNCIIILVDENSEIIFDEGDEFIENTVRQYEGKPTPIPVSCGAKIIRNIFESSMFLEVEEDELTTEISKNTFIH
jgi:hypothetical protein